jgi:hypothetical protein
MPSSLPRFLSDLFPLLYGACFLVLLWQAFRVMGKGFRAEPRFGPAPSSSVRGPASGDRTGRITLHPELLDANGQLTRDDLLTVRFSGDNEQSTLPGEGG